MNLTFHRRRVRGGIVQIRVDGQLAGEIWTCRWGYSLRLAGVLWSPFDGEPKQNASGWPSKGFKRQMDAIERVRQLDQSLLEGAARFAAEHNMEMV